MLGKRLTKIVDVKKHDSGMQSMLGQHIFIGVMKEFSHDEKQIYNNSAIN